MMDTQMPSHYTLKQVLGIGVMLATVTGFIVAGVAWFGGSIISPSAASKVADTRLEQKMDARTVVTDSLFAGHDRTVADLGEKVERIEHSLNILVVLRCLDADLEARRAVITAQVPCRRIIDEQGMFQP